MSEIIVPRRRFLTGLAGLLAAPAVIKASSLMQVRALEPSLVWYEPEVEENIRVWLRENELYMYRQVAFMAWGPGPARLAT